jgi:hypothetical protein
MRIQNMKPGDRILIGGVVLKCLHPRGRTSRIGLEDTNGQPVQVIELPPEVEEVTQTAAAPLEEA